MDFGLLPPEVNSGRLYSGPGSAPLLAAATAWDGLATELSSAALSYGSAISRLITEWHGPSAMSMAAAAEPYRAWLAGSAEQAEHTATQARVAAAAYETAHAAAVPPPVIEANRAMLASLVATNALGQNTLAIAATELLYGEMWAQDAAAMYAYAAAAAGATRLTAFTEPPPTSNAVGPQTQPAATSQTSLPQLISAVPRALQGLTTSGPSVAAPAAEPPLQAILDFLVGPTSPLSYFPIGGVPYLLAFQSVLLPWSEQNYAAALAKSQAMSAASGPALAAELPAPGAVATGVSAGWGNAGLVGKLSVPQGWAGAAPAVRPTAFALPAAGLEAAAPAVATDSSEGLFNQMALSSLAGRAITGAGSGTGRSLGVRSGTVPTEPTTATIIVIPDLDE